RIWGSTDLVHWYNFDPDRMKKSEALELDVGGKVIPTITPDAPDAVESILRAHLTPSPQV
ncbi:MAG TPA: hypothetical protein VMK16_05910, partial [Acidimicrobiales bacterium]|nr:hypothetical protein [Acidimicrobiales bacterium]